ncbi:MAG TPA: PglZ domain-containing protein [Thermoanaerobaculaceae bacterium]|nr:PglZ domain-containing protein [Thermoanaerobaculaceae bacterium]
MHPFHDYLIQQLDDLLKKRSVVVFYDPRSEFVPFFDRELPEVGKGHGDLPRVFIGERLTFVARYQGSFFGVRAAVEPIAALDKPEPLIIYLPGVARDREGSVLMELEKAGACYEPQLKRLALNVLRKKFTDGQIDEMLRPSTVTYDDIVSFLAQGDDGAAASVLRALFDGAQREALLARWLADETRDDAIQAKEATAELLKLIEARLGLALPATATAAEAREKTLRYVLIGEFRSDLSCDPPASVSMVPVPSSQEQIDRLRELAETLRKTHGEQYVVLADRVASDLNLEAAKLDAAHLGRIDTFRFEERRLLAYAGDLIATRRYDEAAHIVADRSRSFWVDREVGRQAQWEVCRLMAELGQEIERVRPSLAKIGSDPAKWVAAYTSEDGWHQVDALQRRLETWAAKMDEEPETEKALSVIRREHEELLRRMAEGFVKALAGCGWTVTGALHQTRIYPDVVQTMGGRTAYFLVDALRFEMGVDLAQQLQGARDLTVRPAIAALPSITPVGMAALLPGASASLAVVNHKGKLAANVEGSVMPGLNERLKFLKAKVPDAVDVTLGKLLGTPPSKLGKLVGEASLVVVRSQEIDFMGEMDSDLLARQVMDTVIGNIARAVKKLAAAGIENFVITGDHGHQFSIRKDEDMRTDNPGGDTLDIHRRCWIGRGGSTPPGTVRVTGAELGYQTDLDFVFPTSLGVFKAAGGLCFHHGGASLQEIVVPVLSLRMPSRETRPPRETVAELRGVPDKITNRTFGIRVVVMPSLFAPETVALRVVLVCGSEQVGQAGMVVGADFDRASGILRVKPGAEASIGLMLTRDDCAAIRVVVQDPATDAVLAQSEELPVKLGI